MCGIAGYIGKGAINAQNCRDTLVLMQERGPDASDFCMINDNELHIALLHSRLSILDLNPRSNQPFTKDHCTIVFNGEIYNYVELRDELSKKGVNMETSSDTEVLLSCYLLYGNKCVDHFEGMWAFAIYDRKKRALFLSRDRFAEKPLYYTNSGNGFYFASESRFLKTLTGKSFEINDKHLMRYMINGHKSLYKTSEQWYKGIKELPFASNLIVDSQLRCETIKYWRPEFETQHQNLDEAIEQVRSLLLNAMKIRLRSDVPLAFNLSGGVDSSSLASIAAKEFNYKVVSFSIIDSDERYNELDNIQATIDDIGCENIQVKLSPDTDYLSMLDRLIAYHDAPLATISYLVHARLSEKISEHGYKVAFSGTGADEIFTGYYDHFILHLQEMADHPEYEIHLNDWKQHVRNFVRNPFLRNPECYKDNPSFRDHIYLNNDIFSNYLLKPFKEPFSEIKYRDSLLRNRMLNELFHEVTRVILHEDDLNSMMHSIENRSPFLDTNLISFVYGLPASFLIRNGYAKYLLREAMKGILNDKVRLDREKKGFNASINSVINPDDPRTVDRILDPGPVYDLVDRKKIETLLKQGSYTNSFKKFLFNFINVRIFTEQCS